MKTIVQKFKNKPTNYYAMSIVASWAGVGSLMNFRTIALEYGSVPAIIWAVFNSLACALFGLIVAYLPNIRKIMKTRIMFIIIGLLTIFQTWTQMSGIQTVFADTVVGNTGGMILAYAVTILFVVFLYTHGMIRNVLTDSGSWVIVYGLLVAVIVAAFIYTKGQFAYVADGLSRANINQGIINGLLLLPGPFTNPYYYEIYEYNEENEDGTQKGNIKLAFILAGIMFGVYMILAAALTWVQFSPVLNFLKAILISIIAISSITSYVYAEYIVFGKKGGLAVNVFTVGGWYFLIPLGVMGIWQLMSKLRWMVVVGVIIAAMVMRIRERNAENS